eukprot:scaffold26671_cov127-Skeletonema_menzelii.AAC.4
MVPLLGKEISSAHANVELVEVGCYRLLQQLWVAEIRSMEVLAWCWYCRSISSFLPSYWRRLVVMPPISYRRKARDTHPDKRGKDVSAEEAAEAFRQVVHAFEILSDDNSRRRYDRGDDVGSSTSSTSSSSSSSSYK